MLTYAIKGTEKILVTSANKDYLVWYKFIQEENEEEEIKQKYNNIILSKYPYHTQINMSADIQEIHLNARNEERAFTEEEMLKVAEALRMKTWIQEQREECAKEINLLN